MRLACACVRACVHSCESACLRESAHVCVCVCVRDGIGWAGAGGGSEGGMGWCKPCAAEDKERKGDVRRERRHPDRRPAPA